jgi:hypothetical protein
MDRTAAVHSSSSYRCQVRWLQQRARLRGRTISLSQRILIIDDNKDAAQAMGMLISALGGEAHIAHDGHDGGCRR